MLMGYVEEELVGGTEDVGVFAGRGGGAGNQCKRIVVEKVGQIYRRLLVMRQSYIF